MKKDGVAYLSGKIRGCNEYKAIFSQAEKQLKAMGFAEIFNPAEQPKKTIREAFATDMDFICHRATHVCMIHNYRDSLGALSEYHLAKALKVPVIFLKKPKPKVIPKEELRRAEIWR